MVDVSNPRCMRMTWYVVDDLPKLAPLAIVQGVVYGVACAFQTFGIIAAGTVGSQKKKSGLYQGGCTAPFTVVCFQQRFPLVKIYAFLCALSTLLVIGIAIMRVITHFVFKACRSCSFVLGRRSPFSVV